MKKLLYQQLDKGSFENKNKKKTICPSNEWATEIYGVLKKKAEIYDA